MVMWSFVLFGLGILAFLDSQFNYGYLFRTSNSIVFMLVSLGVLVRTRTLAKHGFRERLIENNDELRTRMLAMRDSIAPIENQNPKDEVAIK